MKQSRAKGPKDAVIKSEPSLKSEEKVAELGETKSHLTRHQDRDLVDLTQSDPEDPTYVDASEKKKTPQRTDAKAKTRTAMKRKAEPVEAENAEGHASEPDAKPAAKKSKASKPKDAPKGTTAGRGKKANTAAKPKQDNGRKKAKPKSKNKLTEEGREARRECKALKSEVDAKEKEIQRLKKVTGYLQEQHFNLLRKGNSAFMDDGEVRNKLFDLRESCRAWSTNYSMSGGLPDLDESSMETLLWTLTSSERMVLKEQNITVIGNLKQGSMVILNGLLLQFICSRIIEQPFFFLQSSFEQGQTREVREFLDDLSNSPLNNVHDWVSTTLDMLAPTVLEATNTNENFIWDGISEPRSRFYGECAKEFINGIHPAKMLLSPQSENCEFERITSLKDIMKEAGELSIRLRKQRTGIRCLYLDSPKLTQKGFQADSGLMEFHESMCLEEGTRTLDGKEIIMVVEPAIIAHWTDGSDEVEKEKVWAKSVVWVDGWDPVGDTKEAGNVSPEHKTSLVDWVEPIFQAPAILPATTTADSRNDGKLDDLTTPVCASGEIAAAQNTSANKNSDNPVEIPPRAAPVPMALVSGGDEDSLMQGTENPGIYQYPPLPLNLEAKDTPTAKPPNEISQHKSVRQRSFGNGENSQQAVCKFNYGPRVAGKPKPARANKNKSPSLGEKDETEPARKSSHNEVVKGRTPVTGYRGVPGFLESPEAHEEMSSDVSTGGREEYAQRRVEEPRSVMVDQKAVLPQNEDPMDYSKTIKSEPDDSAEKNQCGGSWDTLSIKTECTDEDAKSLLWGIEDVVKVEAPAMSSDEQSKYIEDKAKPGSSPKADTQAFMDDKKCLLL
ncbi:hypothetical protein FQN54_003503 [Arachnomyces sp. PD_36]|nr:hypothetical protein FQN54_003503 [Arachnomyces sp. PD_36]